MRFKNSGQKVASFLKDPFRHRTIPGAAAPSEPLQSRKPNFRQTFSTQALATAWLGHASVFLHMEGKNILVDPIFSKRSSPFPFLGPVRFPGEIPVASDFPKLDAILLTHNHYDHMDIPTIKALDGQTQRYFVPTGLAKTLIRHGIAAQKIQELTWHESAQLGTLQITCTPAHHNSRRTLWDGDKTLWCSFVLKSEEHAVFICGDTGFSSHFEAIHKAFGDFDLAIMECGQYGEYWHHLHMFPEESVEAAKILHAKLAIPVHWGAYVLAWHSWSEPPERFRQRAAEESVNCIIPVLNELYYI